MKHVSWTDATFALGDGLLLGCKAGPLDDSEPMDLQRVVLQQQQQHLTLVMSVDQLDELEHELERARWHRTFKQAELRKAAMIAVDTELENPPDPRDAEEPHSILDLPDGGPGL